jgi:propanol-preferring alcohol dehydrogenase
MTQETMRALRYHGPGKPLRLERVPRPDDPGPHEALVKVGAAGVCHTELHFLNGTLDLGVRPLILGHEIAGTVEKLGPGRSRIKEGDRVVVYYYAGCGTCEHCLVGEENLCAHPRQVSGFFHDGGFAEYVRTPTRSLVPLGASTTLEQAAPIGCSIATGVHALARTPVRPGDWVLVLGTGAVGFGLIQLCRMAGGRVLAVGRSPRKLEIARTLGAEVTIDAAREDVVEAVRHHTRGHGADLLFELVGSRDTMPLVVPSLAKHGRAVFIGYTGAPMELSPLALVLVEGTITASVGNTLAELRRAVALVEDGQVRTVVDRVATFEEIEEVLHDLEAGKILGRVVLRPDA